MGEKLYELSWVENEESIKDPLSYSHSLDKLKDSVPVDSWKTFSKVTHDNYKVLESCGNGYPKYLIYEVNFIV